ncbi:S8 family serine peptidase [Jiangella gansuensis]|uniref:S8 family serine peptidase n=1 Tax=Jiangella gansuensis TaxID=281473 RepID=UPI0004B9D377|nr:S8 family serine peptidase [Jiangella gansuensis]
MSDPKSRWSRLPVPMLTAAALTVLGTAAPTATSAPAPVGTGPAVTSGAGQTYQVTLLTGDVVALHIAPDGRQAAWIEESATERQPRIAELDGHVHVVPDEAVAYLESGALDERLFDVTYLAQEGYHDAATAELPLLLAAPDGPGIRSVPEAPPGIRAERELDSLDAVVVAAPKDDVRDVWQELVSGAVGQIWLNGRVEVALDESVPQVGAPAAWEAGLDGTGATVAVLDTGWDPGHPDLAGQVTGAANFTEDTDPEGQPGLDGHGHGTHVAATIAGTGAASDGVTRGVAPGADLLVGKVLDANGSGYEDWIIAGMEWAVEQGADVVNLSLGTNYATDGTDPLSQAVDRLSETSDSLFVVAAGNIGPDDGSVTSPGAATTALTVGAVDKADQPAAFSSRGPRRGDGAVKPEIVAPGVGIVAARAAGTSLGNLLDEHYTSMNGTSMATPHVAGAAAIVAQQHADWDGEQIKERLVSSSVTLPEQPLTFQGGGRLDIASATADAVSVDQGVVDLGHLGMEDPAVSRTLTYHNPTDRRVTLRLTAEVTRPGSGQVTPALRVRDRVLAIPPRGTASTQVEVAASASPGGTYTGQIVATDPRNRGVNLHSVVAFTVERPVHTITVTATDRDGAPAAGPVDLWNTETGEWTRGFLRDGTEAIEVPAGRYTLVTAIETPGDGILTTSETIAGEPELLVDDDISLRYDARDGEPVEVVTPRPADVEDVTVTWHRQVAEQSMTRMLTQNWFEPEVYVIASDRPRTGTFEFSTTWQLVEPLLTATVPGPDGFQLDPYPALISQRNPYVGAGALRVVDVGTGTAAEFAAAGDAVDGAVALVTRRESGDATSEQLELARDAGAALVLIANDGPGGWSQSLWSAPHHAYAVSGETGDRLRAALAADPGRTVDVVGLRDSTYNYELAFTDTDGIPGGTTYDVTETPLATVETQYRQASERMNRQELWAPYVGSATLGTGLRIARNGPVHRTEYITSEGVEWQRFGQPHQEFPGLYWTWSAIRPYETGSTTQRTWWGPLVAPGTPALSGAEEYGLPVARFRDAIRISIPHYLYGPALYGTIFEQAGDRSELVLRRNGEVVGTSTWSDAQFTVPAEEADFALSLSVTSGPGHFSDLSTHTETTWGFRSGRPEDARDVLPLVQLGYGLDAGLNNDVPAGETYPLVVTPAYQPGATGPGGFTVAAEVSFDDGASWQEVPVTASGAGTFRAEIPAAGAGFASVRVSATDGDGNSVSQRIDRAWRIGTAG